MVTSLLRAFSSQGFPLLLIIVVIGDKGSCPLTGLILHLCRLGCPDHVAQTRGKSKDKQNNHQPRRCAELPVQRPPENPAGSYPDHQIRCKPEGLPVC